MRVIRKPSIFLLYLANSLLFYVICVIVGYIGAQFALENHSVSLVWPLSGVALAILLLMGRRYWLPILLAEISLGLLNQAPLTACLTSVGSTAAAYTGAVVLQWFDFQLGLERVRDVLVFVIGGVIGSSMISASVATGVMYFIQTRAGGNFPRFWFSWWLGDALGVLVIAPALLIWFKQPFHRMSWKRRLESFILVGGLVATSWFTFQYSLIPVGFYPLAYLLFPFMVWAALRFSQRMVTSLTLIMSVIAMIKVEQQMKVQISSVVWSSETFLGLYIVTIAMTAMLLAAILIEQKKIQSKVVSLEDRFSKAFLLAPVAISITTLPEGRFVDVNGQFCRLFGFEREEVLGKTALELNLWESRELRIATIAQLREQGSITQHEMEVRVRTGETRQGLSSVQLIVLNGEEHMLAMFYDITEYREAEAALAQSEERYRELFEGINDAIFVHDLDGNILDVNEVACAQLGYNRVEISKLNMADIDAPELAASLPKRLDELRQSGQSRRNEGFFITHDGEHIPVDLNSKLIHYHGQPTVLTVARDVTKRREIEEKLRESEARYRAVVEDQAELICRYKPDGVLTFVNDAYCRHYGRPREQFVGYNFLPLIHEADRQRIQENLRMLTAEHPVMTSENRTLMPDGTIHWHQWTDHAITDENGRVVEYQSVGKDITELKAMEQVRLTTALEREKVKILADFIAAASHDFRTPLSVINTSAYLLNRGAPSAYSDKHFKTIQEQTHYIEQLVDGLLTMSRLDRGDVFNFLPFNLNRLIERIEQQKRSQAEQKSLALTLELAPNLPSIEGDEEWIYHCAVQIVNNAIQFTEANGRIVIRTLPAGEQVAFEVSDTGIGIAAEDLPHIFERLYRGEEHRPVGGQGLGLSIAKKIVDIHNGSIVVTSLPGKGSTFRVQLPIKRIDTNVEPLSFH